MLKGLEPSNNSSILALNNSSIKTISLRETNITMQENFLHYLWRLGRFDQKNLQTTQGESLSIIQIGEYNTDAGPDFTNARLQIGDTIWAGNVEIHVNASEWIKHKHDSDKAYNNVILHVVLEEDQPIFRSSGERIPALELRKRIPKGVLASYQKLLHNEHWIPCQHHFYQVDEFTRNMWLDRMMVERLERKTIAIQKALELNMNSWADTFYQRLARNFGVKVNSDPFELLAKSIPLNILSKYKNSLLQIEALLFGQSGLLEETFEEEYPQKLQKEYLFLQQKHQLVPIRKETWKFLRLRPANFPTIRIAQFAQLIFQSAHLFSKMLVAQNVKELENMFELKLSNYWQTHYVFGKESTKRNKSLGTNTIHLLIINTICPFLFLYGKMKDEDSYKKKALQLLEELAPEKNSITKKWKELGVSIENAYQSQALIELKNEHCAKKKCLECGIGNKILK